MLACGLLRGCANPGGAKNPGGFDYGQWLRGQGYVASGYLRSVAWVGSSNLSPEPAIKTAALVHRELLNAVLLGQRDAVPAHLWALFRATGTTHLMVVSGLHVGIFVGFIHGLAFMLLRCLRFYRSGWVPQRMALLTSLITLSILVGQMGLQAPVMRASLMAGGIAVAGIFLRRVNIWRIFWLSMGGAGVAATKSHSASGFLAFLCSGFGPFVVFRATQAAAILGSRFNALPRGAAGVFDALAWCNCW